MSTVTYPSAGFPAFPGVSAAVPAGWLPRTVPAAQIVAVEPDGPGAFRANLVVRVSRFAAATSFDDVAGQAMARLEGAPGFRDLGHEHTRDGEHRVFRAAASWQDPQVGTVSQAVTLVEVAHHDVRDLVEVTTSCGGGAGTEAWAAGQAVHASLRVDVAAATGPGDVRADAPAGFATVAFPSAQFPGNPVIDLPCPDGWAPVAAPSVQLAISRESAPDAFRPNVVVTVTRLEEGVELRDVAKAAAAALEARDRYEERRRGGVGVSGLPGYVLQGAWVAADVGTVAQDVRGAIVEHDGVRDLVEVTATCAGGQVDPVWTELGAILDGVRVHGVGGAAR